MNVEKIINELIDKINYHNEKYYNEDSPEISCIFIFRLKRL